MPLGSLGHFWNGAAFKPSDWSGQGTPIIRIQNLNDPTRPMNRTTRVVDDRLLIRAGDLLVSWSASLDAYVWKREDAWLNQHIFKVVPKADVVDHRYMLFLLKNEIENLKRTEHLHGSTMMHINRGPFLAHLVPLPPMNTQKLVVRRIDELLTEVEDGEAALERARGDLATWRKALLKAAVTGELTADWRAANPPTATGADLLAHILAERRTRWLAQPRNKGKRYVEPAPPARDHLATLPPGWAEATVEQIAFVENGQTPKGIDMIVSDRGEIPWFKVSSMNAEGNAEKLTSSNWRLDGDQAKRIGLRVHPVDTIVFPKRGGSIFTEKKRRLGCPGAIDLNVMAVVPTEPVKEYMWTFLQGISLTVISDGSNVPQINYDDVSTLVVPLPPPDESSEIAARVRETLHAMQLTWAELEEQAEASAALRQSILASAFRGELVA